MPQISVAHLALHAAIEEWPLTEPFRIAGHTFHSKKFVVVTLEKDGMVARGEAAGVRYRNDDADSMLRQIESLRKAIEGGISRNELQSMLPAGGARNALDCALWDLEAKLAGVPAWQMAGLDYPKPLRNVITCGADTPERMADKAKALAVTSFLKLKLTGDAVDADRVCAVRQAREDAWLSVDANQGFTRPFLERLFPTLVEARVALVEQPFPIGQETLLDGLQSPIPVAADESVQCLAELPSLVGRFDVINIKLDKCGGLTEALAMARAARKLELRSWVGNMFGTSLAMAPAYLAGQLCDFVELDGPLFLRADRQPSIRFADGLITCPEALWGHPH